MDKKPTFAQRLAASLANTDAAALESFPYGRKSKAVDPWGNRNRQRASRPHHPPDFRPERLTAMKKLYEITMPNWVGDGSDDNGVIWVAADDESQIRAAIAGSGVRFHGAIEEDAEGDHVDFTLPADGRNLIKHIRKEA